MKTSIAQSYIMFLNNPNIDDVHNAGKFIVKSTGKPFISDVVLFAANINGNSSEKPTLFYNEEMKNVLENNIKAIRALQEKGIKVQLSYLGNHQNAGWSANMSQSVCSSLADMMVNDINKYNLDGLCVDDEYSLQSGNKQSFHWLLQAIKTNHKFDGKKLTKALWNDSGYFSGETNIAPLLTEGYEMTYSGNVSLLNKYTQYGMSKSSLLLGISPQSTSVSSVRGIGEAVIKSGYAGIMIWAPNAFLSTTQAEAYFSEMLKAKNGDNASVIYLH